MFYNARWYDPALGRFAQADSVVPDGVQGYDRYAYANNNPILYNDPTGHVSCGGSNWDDGPQCKKDGDSKEQYDVVKHPEHFRLSQKQKDVVKYLQGCASGSLPSSACHPDTPAAWNVSSSWDLDPQHPDYTATTVNIFLWAGELTKDRYGRYYISPLGVTGSTKTVLPVGVVSSEGYIGSATDNSMPNIFETNDFLTGPAVNVGGGAGTVGGGATFSPVTWIWKGMNISSHDSPVAWESSTFYVPSVGITLTWNIPIP
jgi:hypothetical protein